MVSSWQCWHRLDGVACFSTSDLQVVMYDQWLWGLLCHHGNVASVHRISSLPDMAVVVKSGVSPFCVVMAALHVSVNRVSGHTAVGCGICDVINMAVLHCFSMLALQSATYSKWLWNLWCRHGSHSRWYQPMHSGRPWLKFLMSCISWRTSSSTQGLNLLLAVSTFIVVVEQSGWHIWEAFIETVVRRGGRIACG